MKYLSLLDHLIIMVHILIVDIKISTLFASYNKENQLKFATQGILSRRLHLIFLTDKCIEVYALTNIFTIVTLHFQAYIRHIYLKILLGI